MSTVRRAAISLGATSNYTVYENPIFAYRVLRFIDGLSSAFMGGPSEFIPSAPLMTPPSISPDSLLLQSSPIHSPHFIVPSQQLPMTKIATRTAPIPVT
ncbi:hypothetical protein [Oceanobacillus senegalensis]|uniref:hypothetical protein n=1 Tax=Oceanobacillus senegalensis TaxID=1936063 RepID=UPI001C4EA47F|nr:hypothetical protein [Oceanobacillus senegalensis]